jgi:predicted dehydrogenase
LRDASRPVRVALVGYGLGGAAFHAPVIHATDGLALEAVVTSDPDRAADARARYPHATVLPDAAEVWAGDDPPDVAVLATPNRTHVPLGLEALDAGLHVVVDKPLAASADDARRLQAAGRDRNRMVTVYQNRRWDGDFRTLQRLLTTGDLGDVHRMESRFEGWRPVPKDGWRQNPDPEEAGGLLYDLGAHLIDQALLLFGPVRDVHAEVDIRRDGARVDDDVFLALEHENRVRSHLWMNKVAAAPGPRFRVLGSAGTWTKAGQDPQEAWLRAGGSPTEDGFGIEPESAWGVLHDGEAARPVPTEPGHWRGFYEAVVRAVRTGAPPPVDPADAIATLEVIEAARRAAGLPVPDGG